GVADPPSPEREAPMSATITLAPAAAIISAISRPMPPPAPVTTATLPSIIPAMRVLHGFGYRRVLGRARRLVNPAERRRSRGFDWRAAPRGTYPHRPVRKGDAHASERERDRPHDDPPARAAGA